MNKENKDRLAVLKCGKKNYEKEKLLGVQIVTSSQGRPSPPETMMHFPPCLRFPPCFQKILRFFGKFQKLYLSRKNFRFSSAKISDDLFFSHRPQILNFSPILPVLVHFPL